MAYGLLTMLRLLAAIGAAQAMLLPQAQSTSSTGRHSISHGPILEHASYHVAAIDQSASPELIAFNADTASLSSLVSLYAVDQPEERGASIANAFVGSLHRDKTFRVQSSYHSEASNIFHSHYVQQINGKDIVNALVNVNVDLSTGQVLSYGNSAWSGHKSCTEPANNGQMVFSTQEECTTTLSVPIPEQILDPRLALVSFISLGNPESFSPEIDDITVSTAPTDSVILDNVPGALQPVPAKLAYVQSEAGLDLVWSFEYKSENNWYEAHVRAVDEPESLLVVDWQKDYAGSLREPRLGKSERFWDDEDVLAIQEELKEEEKKDAIYRVFAFGVNDPFEGQRAVAVNPADADASPLGWHQVPREHRKGGRSVGELPHQWEHKEGWSDVLKRGVGMNFTDTRGNNAFVQANPTGGNEFELNYRPTAPGLNFTFPLHWGCQGKECEGKDIKPSSYINVSATELFFTCNKMHDLTYKYGFDEAAGNFQERNIHKGHKGLGNDAVIANAQDGSGFNNANFATPPDGQRPRMRMYVWNGALPWRDGSLEEGIVVHEYTHGVSTRLTGGPANSGCLPWGESGGMGEGWGDWIATLIRMHKKKPKDWSMGEWASGRAGGIRKYPYSLNHTVNPFTYKNLDKLWEVHAIGEVWSEFLFVMVEGLVKKHGFDHSLFPPSPGEEHHHEFFNTSVTTGKQYPARGNTLAMQLVLDGMKLQPCRPSFLDARDAIIAADHALTGGDNYCTLYEAWADRGMGPDAKLRGALPWGGGFRTEDFDLPRKCRKSHV